jgi:hypothetical protein
VLLFAAVLVGGRHANRLVVIEIPLRTLLAPGKSLMLLDPRKLPLTRSYSI